jgi:hypothetical protein
LLDATLRRYAAQIVELQKEPASDRREEKISATIMLVPSGSGTRCGRRCGG